MKTRNAHEEFVTKPSEGDQLRNLGKFENYIKTNPSDLVISTDS
jgi:hypothetical protein